MKKYTKSFIALSLSFTMASQNVMIITNAQEVNSVKTSEETSLVGRSLSNKDSSYQSDPKKDPQYNMGLPNSSTFSITPRALPNLEVTPITNPNVIGLGVSNANSLNVRSGPSSSYEILGTISNGTNVEVLEKNNNWYKISFNDSYGYVSASYISLNPIQKGIDVSKWNGTVDWNKVKASGIDYVIIRAGYGSSTVDPNFHSYIQGAINAGLEIGIYWFSYATSESKAKIEAQKCLETISPYKDSISYPVFFDFEYDSVDYALKQGVTVTKDLATGMANTFLDYVESQGYMSGLYTNNDFGSRYFSNDLLTSSYLWVAQYSSVCTYPTPYMMWQYTDKGTIDGIGTSSNPKYFDMNYTFLKPSKTSTTNKIDLSTGSVDEISSQVYTGEEIKPSIKVTYEGEELVLGTDYEVSYSNNISIGTANVTITGIGNYEGSIETTFEIIKYVPEKIANISLSKKTADSLSFSWSKLNDVSGYEIYKYDESTKSYKLLKDINSSSTTAYTDTNLTSATSYSYKIRGYKVINGEYFYGDFSNVFTETTSEPTVIKTGVTTETVNVRKGPSTSYDKIGKLASGTKVEIIDIDSKTGWYKIKYNNSYAYVSNLYVNIQDSSTDSTTTKTGVTTASVNIRKGPSTSYDKIGKLASGTKVEIIDIDSKTGWYKIKYNNSYAYVSNLYVNIQNSSTDSTTTKTGVTTASVNIRKGPSTSYDKVATLASGTKVEIVGTDSKTGWYKIKYNNSYAYVSNLYVNIQNSSTGSTTTKTGVTTASVNIRKGPSTSYDKVGKLASGTKVEIVGTDSKTGWYKIKYNNSYAYVSNLYVNIQGSSTGSTTTKTGVTTASVNIRKGPSTSYDKVGKLASGTKVEIVGTDSKTGWYKIKYNNGYAYVSNLYVNINK